MQDVKQDMMLSSEGYLIFSVKTMEDNIDAVL